MMSKENPIPFDVPPTSVQIKTALWLGVIVSLGFWCIFVYIALDRGLTQSLIALPLPILATGSTVSVYFKYKRLFNDKESA